MFFTVIAILSLILAFPESPRPLLTGTRWVLPLVAIVTVLPGLIGVVVARRSLRLIDAHPEDPNVGQMELARGSGWIAGALLVGHSAVIGLTDWLNLCNNLPSIRGWLAVPSLAAAGPFLISIGLAWIGTFPAERALRQIHLEMQLLRGQPARPTWPLLRHLVFNYRHQVLFILAPMLLILVARDLIDWYSDSLRRTGIRYLPDLLLGLSAGAVAVIAPAILRRVWLTHPLPDGPLRDRLLRLGRKLHLRFREILVWRSGGALVNAAVMGVIAPLRYILITDGMLESMDDTKIEAVFGHEAGHVKRHHITYFLMLAFMSGCWIAIYSDLLMHPGRQPYEDWIGVALGAVLLVKWSIVFGWISRTFERQADLFGVRTLELSGLPCATPCATHAPAVTVAAGGDPICRTAAHVFADALYDVAALNGIPPQAPSWRHGSIATRANVLQAYAADPQQTAQFERRVVRLKLGILAATALSTAAAAWFLRVWEPIERWLR